MSTYVTKYELGKWYLTHDKKKVQFVGVDSDLSEPFHFIGPNQSIFTDFDDYGFVIPNPVDPPDPWFLLIKPEEAAKPDIDTVADLLQKCLEILRKNREG